MKILIGISSSIAIYKICDLARLFTKNKFDVHIAMTKNASSWINPNLFQSITTNPVLLDSSKEFMPHIDIRKNLKLFLIAPATANIIAKASHGIADDFITTTLLSYDGPKWLAPAMNPFMYQNSIVQDNIKKLKKYQFHILNPIEGEAVCGDEGEGKMMPVENIYENIISFLSNKSTNKKIEISKMLKPKPL